MVISMETFISTSHMLQPHACEVFQQGERLRRVPSSIRDDHLSGKDGEHVEVSKKGDTQKWLVYKAKSPMGNS